VIPTKTLPVAFQIFVAYPLSNSTMSTTPHAQSKYHAPFSRQNAASGVVSPRAPSDRNGRNVKTQERFFFHASSHARNPTFLFVRKLAVRKSCSVPLARHRKQQEPGIENNKGPQRTKTTWGLKEREQHEKEKQLPD